MALKGLLRLFIQLLVSSFAKIAQLPLPPAPALAPQMYWLKHTFVGAAAGYQAEYHDVVPGATSNRGQNMAGPLTRLSGFLRHVSSLFMYKAYTLQTPTDVHYYKPIQHAQ